jgi:thymidylate kinase
MLLEDIKRISSFALQGFTYDVKIVLDVRVEVAEQRISKTGVKKDYWELQGTAFFKKIRKAYLDLAQAENCHVVDASGESTTVHRQIVKILNL